MRAANTNSSIREIPVTMSGFIMGMFVTVITALRSRLERILWMSTAARVPMTVASTAASTESTRVLRKACSVP